MRRPGLHQPAAAAGPQRRRHSQGGPTRPVLLGGLPQRRRRARDKARRAPTSPASAAGRGAGGMANMITPLAAQLGGYLDTLNGHLATSPPTSRSAWPKRKTTPKPRWPPPRERRATAATRAQREALDAARTAAQAQARAEQRTSAAETKERAALRELGEHREARAAAERDALAVQLTQANTAMEELAGANATLTATLAERDRDLAAARADVPRLEREVDSESGKRAAAAAQFAETKAVLADTSAETDRIRRQADPPTPRRSPLCATGSSDCRPSMPQPPPTSAPKRACTPLLPIRSGRGGSRQAITRTAGDESSRSAAVPRLVPRLSTLRRRIRPSSGTMTCSS
ncbi:hypothetical protein [Nonomuraea sp. NPDC046570]|uniref:hypothetical protein n=1 Tax=Nonomuraea sp. NPDC046570 TaxID=3155255 RepID=UPI0033EB0D0E